MNLAQFFAKVSPSFFHECAPVIFFKGNAQAYPVLFFSLLSNRLKVISEFPFSYVDISYEEFNVVQSKLETTFLGQRSFFWLKTIEIDEKKRKQLNNYLASYQGPNIIGVFIGLENISAAQGLEVIVDHLIDKKTFLLLASHTNQHSVGTTQQVIQYVFKKYETIPIDTACLLLYYSRVIGSNTEIFFESWLEKILNPEKSLFTLSTYFFAKKASLFFKEWARVSSDYSEQFWIIFWSEQLWRAYHFVSFSREKQLGMAKKIGHRLPFTFMQRDWMQFTVKELSNAHDFLYEIDVALKNSANPVGLDLFYSKFFLSQFSPQ